MAHLFPRLGLGLVAVALGVAGGLKLLDLSAFAAALRGWTLLPAGWIPILAIVVPLVEVGLCIDWLRAPTSTHLPWVLAIALISFSVAYLLQTALGSPPDCACLGVLSQFVQVRQSLAEVLVRNAVLLALLVPSLAPSIAVINFGVRKPGVERSGLDRAFTLVELLVVISVVAVLVALAIPTLWGGRESARRASNLSNLCQLAVGWSTYANDAGGKLPYFIDPAQGIIKVDAPAGAGQLEVEFFDQSHMWPLLMAPTGHTPPFGSAALFTPWTRPETRTTTSYLSPCSFRVDPAHYDETTFQELPAQLRAIGIAEATFPAQKSLLATRMPPERAADLGGPGSSYAQRWGDGVTPAVMVDGHARDVPHSQLERDWGGDGYRIWRGSHVTPQIPLTHAAGGVRGRDVSK